jgi:predicted Zn-dependent protease
MRREALDALRRLYRTTNNLGKLYEVLQRLHKSSPNEASITADLARLGLNLERNTEASHELAKEAYDRAPNELNCAVTYAFSLYRLGRGAEGFAIIQKLPPDQLHDPHAAVYAVLLLLDAKEIDAVEDYIAAADDANIYIEEKKLLDDAKKQLVTASETLPSSVSSASAELSPTPGSTP